MLLSRWIKPSRLNIETDRDSSTQLDFGLRNYRNQSIRFAKYKFESNDNKASIQTWLYADSYERTQYFGF